MWCQLTSKVENKCLNVCERGWRVVEWNKRWSPPFPCCSVNRQCLRKKTFKKKNLQQTNLQRITFHQFDWFLIQKINAIARSSDFKRKILQMLHINTAYVVQRKTFVKYFVKSHLLLVGNYMFKVNNKNTRTRCEIWVSERSIWRQEMFSATAFVESVQLICYWCFIISFNQECEVSVNPKISREMLWQIATLKFIFKKVPVIVSWNNSTINSWI